jgi:hypothetical protein
MDADRNPSADDQRFIGHEIGALKPKPEAASRAGFESLSGKTELKKLLEIHVVTALAPDIRIWTKIVNGPTPMN